MTTKEQMMDVLGAELDKHGIAYERDVAIDSGGTIHRLGSKPSAPLLAANIEPDDLYVVPGKAVFFGNDFALAPDLQDIGDRLISECHELRDAMQWRIRYLWKAKGGASKGQVKLGKCVKTSGALSFFSDVDYIVWLAADNVRDAMFTYRQVEALMFHELCHIETNEGDDSDDTPAIKGHDAEVFLAEIQRYGMWRTDLQRFGQLDMFGGGK